MRKRIFSDRSTGLLGSRIVPERADRRIPLRESCRRSQRDVEQAVGQGERLSIGFQLSGAILAGLAALGLMGCAAPSLKDQQELINQDPRRHPRFSAGAPKRVVLITVAGLRAGDYLDPFGHAAAEGALVHMPTLARMAREGAMGLAALPPSPGSSRATHATLVTGNHPSRHGVVADSTLDGEGARALPFADSRLLNGTPLWDAAVGRGVVALDWPTTGGARIERLLPELVGGGRWIETARRVSSPLISNALEEIAVAAAASMGRTKEGEVRDPASWPRPHEKDAAIVSVACRLAADARDAGVWLIRLEQTAALQRAIGGGTVEVDDALARVDAEIDRIVTCMADADRLADTAFFVIGDVAYHRVHTTVSPNVALARAGLIGRDPRSDTGVRSWLALARSNGRSAYVYARDASNALDAREVLLAEAKRTDAFEIVSAKVLSAAGGDPQAWFALASRPGFLIGDELIGPALRPSDPRGAAGILRTGAASDREAAVGFVAWGRGIRKAIQLPTVELVDVAPTIAALLGLRLGDDLDGEPILGILRAAVEPPPAGPKRLGDGMDLDDRLRELRRGRTLGRDDSDDEGRK